MTSIWLHPASLVLKLTYTSSTHRRGLNPPHRVKSISMTTFTHQEIEFLQKHSNEVLCTLYSKGLSSTIFHIVKQYFLSFSCLWFWLILAFFWTLQSTLLAFLSPPFFLPFLVIPSPPSLYFLSPLSRLCHHPHPNPLLYLPPSSFLCPPCRSVNTSGWASMTTGH